MTSRKRTWSRRVAAPHGRRPAGRRSAARFPRALPAAAFLAAVLSATGCGGPRHAAHLTADLERSFPGSRIEIAEVVEDGTRTVEVSIVALELPAEVAELGEQARSVARLARDRFGLRAGDVVVVLLRSEDDAGAVVRSRQRARFVVPVGQLGRG